MMNLYFGRVAFTLDVYNHDHFAHGLAASEAEFLAKTAADGRETLGPLWRQVDAVCYAVEPDAIRAAFAELNREG